MSENNHFFLFHITFNSFETTFYGKERKSKKAGQYIAYLKATKSSWDLLRLEIIEVKMPNYEVRTVKVVKL